MSNIKLLTVTFHNEKHTLQNPTHSHSFFDLKHDYGNKIMTKTDTSSSVDYPSLETKASSDYSDDRGLNLESCTSAVISAFFDQFLCKISWGYYYGYPILQIMYHDDSFGGAFVISGFEKYFFLL